MSSSAVRFRSNETQQIGKIVKRQLSNLPLFIIPHTAFAINPVFSIPSHVVQLRSLANSFPHFSRFFIIRDLPDCRIVLCKGNAHNIRFLPQRMIVAGSGWCFQVPREGSRTIRTWPVSPIGLPIREIRYQGGLGMMKHWLTDLRSYLVGSCVALAVAAGTTSACRAQATLPLTPAEPSANCARHRRGKPESATGSPATPDRGTQTHGRESGRSAGAGFRGW